MSSFPGVKFWDLDLPLSNSPSHAADAESWYGDDEEDFGFDNISGQQQQQQQQPARRQKRKRWGCSGSRTAVVAFRYPGCEEDKTPLSGHQRESPEGRGAVGFEQVARPSEHQPARTEEREGVRRSEEFVYSSNWESDSSAAPDDEREE